MLKTCAIVFGLIMLVIGVLGFVPQATPDGYLLGIFHVNLEHNSVHILTGIISIVCGFAGFGASRVFFQIFGIVYAIIGVLGFYHGNTPVFGILANNLADSILHVVIGALSLFLGFGCCCSCKVPPPSNPT